MDTLVEEIWQILSPYRLDICKSYFETDEEDLVRPIFIIEFVQLSSNIQSSTFCLNDLKIK